MPSSGSSTEVSRWAGHFRRTDKSMGVPWPEIALAYRQLRDGTQYWIDHSVYPADELAIRYKHRLVSIHPFPNGNGRHSRLLGDLLVESLGRPVFTWGTETDDPRTRYLQALKQADTDNIVPLLKFARQ